MKRIKGLFSKMSARTRGTILAGGLFAAIMISCIAAFADGTNEAVSAASTLMGNITSTLNISNAVAILSAGLGAVVGLFLAWWGSRKLANMVVNVFRKGKIKF